MRTLRARFPISSTGARFSDLVEIARDLHLDGRAIFVSPDEIKCLRLPCVLHWSSDHFVVLTQRRRRSIMIHDPARGEREISFSDFNIFFGGAALELSPQLNFERRPEAARVRLRQVTGRIVGLRRGVSQVMALAMALQMFALVVPLLSQWVIDEAIISSDYDLIWLLCIGLTGATILRVILDLTRGWLSLALTTQMMAGWCKQIMSHLMRLPATWFEVRHVGDVVSRFQSTHAVQQALTGKVSEIALDSVFCLGLIAVMFLYSAPLIYVALGSVLVYGILRTIPHASYHRSIQEAVVQEAKAQSHFIESLRAMQTIKTGVIESNRTAQWSSLMLEAVARRFAAQKMMLMFGSGYSIIFGVQAAITLGLGASAVASGTMTLGMFLAFTSYKDDFCVRAQRLFDNILSLRGLQIHVDRLAEIVLEKEENVGVPLGSAGQRASRSSAIEIDSIGYRYSTASPWIFRGLNLRIEEGEHVAIIGASGTGKSTLVKLILGLLSPVEGQIRHGGMSVEKMGIAQWRTKISVVMQGDQLLSGNLMENISFFSDEVDMGLLLESARNADILADIEELPMKFFTEVGDLGTCLSGGQRQRVLLARALYRRPTVLILDEATSHLDVASERRVNASISALSITRITIAHRPETIASASRSVDFGHLRSSV